MFGETPPLTPTSAATLQTDQAEAIRAEVEREALVSPLLPLEQLMEDYRDSPNFLRKIAELRQLYGKTALRRLRKDGSCFYRATVYRLAETLTADPPAADRLLALLPRARRMFLAVGMEPLVFEDFEEVWASLLQRIRSGEVCAATLHAVLADAEHFNFIVMYLRFVISAWIRTEPHFDDYFGSAEEKRAFCAAEVEQLSAEADQPQIVALHNFLALPLRIFYVDNSPAAGATVLSLPECAPGAAAVAASAGAYPLQLLYRPGHYDLLY